MAIETSKRGAGAGRNNPLLAEMNGFARSFPGPRKSFIDNGRATARANMETGQAAILAAYGKEPDEVRRDWMVAVITYCLLDSEYAAYGRYDERYEEEVFQTMADALPGGMDGVMEIWRDTLETLRPLAAYRKLLPGLYDGRFLAGPYKEKQWQRWLSRRETQSVKQFAENAKRIDEGRMTPDRLSVYRTHVISAVTMTLLGSSYGKTKVYNATAEQEIVSAIIDRLRPGLENDEDVWTFARRNLEPLETHRLLLPAFWTREFVETYSAVKRKSQAEHAREQGLRDEIYRLRSLVKSLDARYYSASDRGAKMRLLMEQEAAQNRIGQLKYSLKVKIPDEPGDDRR